MVNGRPLLHFESSKSGLEALKLLKTKMEQHKVWCSCANRPASWQFSDVLDCVSSWERTKEEMMAKGKARMPEQLRKNKGGNDGKGKGKDKGNDGGGRANAATNSSSRVGTNCGKAGTRSARAMAVSSRKRLESPRASRDYATLVTSLAVGNGSALQSKRQNHCGYPSTQQPQQQGEGGWQQQQGGIWSSAASAWSDPASGNR